MMVDWDVQEWIEAVSYGEKRNIRQTLKPKNEAIFCSLCLSFLWTGEERQQGSF